MTINFQLPQAKEAQELKPRITVLGVGGAGGNAVNNMINARLEGVSFLVANTDAQALLLSKAERKIQLGAELTQGLGAGAKPEIGQGAAAESLPEILDALAGSHMVFITAGMGGGTGTGAAPVIARAVREQGILTVGVVTKPFHFEGDRRMRVAERGIDEMQSHVDTLIIIPNQNLFRVANERTTFAQAFAMADDVLHSGVRGVTDLIVMPGLINRDFADIKTVMSEMGKAMMGTGEMQGEGRALKAAEAAISNPLLDDVSMKGARAVLINVTGGPDLMLFEVDEAVNRVRAEVDCDANILFGSALSEDMEGRVRVSVVATGIDAEQARQANNVQKFPGRRKPAEPAAETAEPECVLPVPEPEALTILSAEPAANAEFLASMQEPLTLGGEDSPVIAETHSRSFAPPAAAPVAPERPKRRVFGLFGGRKREETPAPIEPRFDIRKKPDTEMFRDDVRTNAAALTLQRGNGSGDLQEPAAGERPLKPRADDLFANAGENFEIPAFLRRQKTGS
ncbi:MAG TPA: cell division protein FtsZ [Micropepsaceae bacterium]|nr:cell division protein FtsZ [Micropepsaceae bacterium]